MANLVVEAIQTAAPLRRCTVRMGRGFAPPDGAPVCSAAQLGVALCPCSGTADPARLWRCRRRGSRRVHGDPRIVVDRLHDRMLDLAASQRFEEAALTRDRLSTLLGAVRRHLLVEALRTAEQAEVSFGESTWIIDRGRLLDATRTGTAGRALPIPPPEPASAEVLSREQIDEALCLARFCDKRADRLVVRCSGTWTFPIGDRLPDISSLATRAA